MSARQSCFAATFCALVAVGAFAQEAKKPCTSTATGDLRIQHFEGKIFAGTHTLRVWLPSGYDAAENAKRTYPVLYMLDGQGLFDHCTSAFGYEWKIDETLTTLIAAGKVEPLIVVGIDNAGRQRADEFIPFPDPLSGEGEEVHGKLYPRFVVEEIKPHIDKQFRVRAGPANTAIGGSSYGAVAALYTLLTRPNTFGKGLLESTSMQVGNGELLRMTQSTVLGPGRVYVGVGEAEDDREDAQAVAFNAGFAHMSEELAAALKSAEINKPEVMFVSTPGAHHEQAAWAARFPQAIQFLFPPQK